MIDDRLLEWATPREREYIAAIKQHGSARRANKVLGLANDTVGRSMRALERRAAMAGYSPAHDMTRTVPDGFNVRGVSTYYNKDGAPAGQWVKSEADHERQAEILREFAESLAEQVKGLAPITKPPKLSDTDLLCVYPMGDPHFGMYAWAEEAGADFDLTIAERLTCGAIDRLVGRAPSSETAILLNLGDMFHADNQSNTSKSGHQLDVDGRWSKVQRVGFRAKEYAIRRLLQKHQRVIVRVNRGNHDDHSSQGLAFMLSCYFHNEPRLTVDLSPSPFWYQQFGKVLIGSTHGDKVKGADLLPVMSTDVPKLWGDTTHRYWYVGHVHHQDIKEHRGGVVEYFRTLAARDAWHHGQGYRAGRDMRLIVHHREHGEIERYRCDVGMIDKEAA